MGFKRPHGLYLRFKYMHVFALRWNNKREDICIYCRDMQQHRHYDGTCRNAFNTLFAERMGERANEWNPKRNTKDSQSNFDVNNGGNDDDHGVTGDDGNDERFYA